MLLSNPYLQLMRLDKPVGIWLLFWPCAWSILLACEASGVPLNMGKLLLFFIGSVLMRGAGCVINDIVDRDIDKYVERTKNRPLASGRLHVLQAIAFLVILLLASLIIALELGEVVTLWSGLALLPVVIYPFMKRISWWPQLFLGLTFNWGALVGWVAVRGQVELPALLLYIGGVCWTLGYDTIYAHQDKKDDVLIGVRSTALRLGDKTKVFTAVMYIIAAGCFILAAGNIIAVLTMIPAILHFSRQIYILDISKPESAKNIFLSNVWCGFLVFGGLFFAVISL